MATIKKQINEDIELRDYYFRKDAQVDEWDYFLEQLGIPEEERDKVDSVAINVGEVEYEVEE